MSIKKTLFVSGSRRRRFSLYFYPCITPRMFYLINMPNCSYCLAQKMACFLFSLVNCSLCDESIPFGPFVIANLEVNAQRFTDRFQYPIVFLVVNCMTIKYTRQGNSQDATITKHSVLFRGKNPGLITFAFKKIYYRREGNIQVDAFNMPPAFSVPSREKMAKVRTGLDGKAARIYGEIQRRL